jgi:hypothetical protein
MGCLALNQPCTRCDSLRRVCVVIAEMENLSRPVNHVQKAPEDVLAAELANIRSFHHHMVVPRFGMRDDELSVLGRYWQSVRRDGFDRDQVAIALRDRLACNVEFVFHFKSFLRSA